jgi:hypothetical protein
MKWVRRWGLPATPHCDPALRPSYGWKNSTVSRRTQARVYTRGQTTSTDTKAIWVREWGLPGTPHIAPTLRPCSGERIAPCHRAPRKSISPWLAHYNHSHLPGAARDAADQHTPDSANRVAPNSSPHLRA